MPAALVQMEHHAPFYAVEIKIYFAALELHPPSAYVMFTVMIIILAQTNVKTVKRY
uniref:Uncharacterized protein n=1 Tax=Anguilla anguilla TaxID=7936 RepID=A0A0E9TP00_ANGAN